MSEVYKVIYTGELKPGTNQAQIITLFSEKFKLGPQRAERLIKSGRSATLKKDIDLEKAIKYQETLEKLGLVIELDPKPPMDEQEELSSEFTLVTFENDEDATEVLDPNMNPSGDRCPKCGSAKMAMGICQDCGIVAAKYLAAQAREAEQVAQHNPTDQDGEGTENPYTTPEAELAQSEEGDMNGPHSVPAGHGLAWIASGWWHFKQAPLTWILVVIVWFVLTFVVSMIPFLGPLAVNILAPVLIAGLMIGCNEQDQGGDFSLSHLFAGFSTNTGQAVMVGVFYLVFIILFMIGFAAFMFGNMAEIIAAQQTDPQAMAMMVSSPGFIIGLLVASLLFIPIMMAYLFAPALVALNDMSAWEAMKASFMGCLKNVLPFFLYSLGALVLMIVGVIPFGLGLLIVSPILISAIYSAYRDIYYS